MEELSSKKNTDCVYFLASPLTCKKGMQCEFRHSEVARLNPRDCWYWLAGNCLNPDCAFRHPPLDAEEEVNPSPEPTSSSTKGRIPCYFYSQGYCAKGDKCSFMHGYPRVYNSSSNQNQQNQQQQTTVTATTTTLNNVPKSAAAASISNKGSRKTVEEPPRETTLTEAMVPEEEKHIEGQVECSSPNEYQPQEFDEEEEPAEKLQDLVVNHRQIDWPLMRRNASSPGYDEPAAETDLYCDDESCEGEEEDEEEDTVLDPGNAPRSLQSLHRAVEPAYEFSWPHLQSSSNGIREPFTNYKIFDPPYQPSVPYDCMISSRQGFMEEHPIHESPEFEALFMARNLGGGMSRRRLEDRLVFPKNSASSNSIANRLKLLNSAASGRMNLSSGGGGNQQQQEELELQAALYGTPHGLRLEKTPTNLRRNGGVLSRLGSSRPSVKSRLRFTNHRQQQHFHQHHQHHQQQQQQQQFHYHHQQHRQRNARYLGLVQRRHNTNNNNNNNNSSKVSSKKTSSSHSRRVFNNSSSIKNSSSSSSLLLPGAKDSQFSSQFSSQFDGPKSLAELKAAKLVDPGL